MKIKIIFSAIISAALILTGCSSNNEKQPENTAKSSQISSNNSSSETSGERAYSKGATQLSVKNGALNINRRTRSESAPTGESGWTILVYLCGSDLESDGANGTVDIEEA